MMPNTFEPGAGAHALEDFRFRTRSYYRGEAFPAEGVEVDKDTMYRMWIAGRIKFGQAPAKQADEAAARRKTEAQAERKRRPRQAPTAGAGAQE